MLARGSSTNVGIDTRGILREEAWKERSTTRLLRQSGQHEGRIS